MEETKRSLSFGGRIRSGRVHAKKRESLSRPRAMTTKK